MILLSMSYSSLSSAQELSPSLDVYANEDNNWVMIIIGITYVLSKLLDIVLEAVRQKRFDYVGEIKVLESKNGEQGKKLDSIESELFKARATLQEEVYKQRARAEIAEARLKEINEVQKR